MDQIARCKLKTALEASDLSVLSSLNSPHKFPPRSWTGLHYACQLRDLSSILQLSSQSKFSQILTECDLSNARPCDLLPVPELSFFNLYTWGVGPDYQLGYPKDKQQIPKKVEFTEPRHPPHSISKIASYKYHSLFITDQKEIFAFGSGRRGMLGHGSELSAVMPVRIRLKQVIQIAVGEMHSLCVTEDRNLFVWGDNSYGQSLESKVLWIGEPCYVKYFKNIYIEKVVAGKNHSAVVDSLGKVHVWGDNSMSQKVFQGAELVVFTGKDIIHSEESVINDIEAYDNFTAMLINQRLVVKSSPSGVQKFHPPSNSPLIALSLSIHSVHTLSSLGVLYSYSTSPKSTGTHYKMKQSLENIISIHSGYKSVAIDKDKNAWILDSPPKLLKDVSCASQICVTEFYSLALIGVERNTIQREQRLTSLFDLAQERVIETVNINTACELLAFSEIFGCEVLKRYCGYFIVRNLRCYMTLGCWEYLLMIPSTLLEELQTMLCRGSLPPIKEVVAQKPIKKQKKKPRAFSGIECQEIIQPEVKPKARERAATESVIILPKQFIPAPASKDKPWGNPNDNKPVSFNELQTEESKSPFKINKWTQQTSNAAESFERLQHEEKEYQDLDEALILIAMMESMGK